MSHFREVAAINVTNVNLIEEFVFSAAFSTFDQVEERRATSQGKMQNPNGRKKSFTNTERALNLI